MKEEKFGGVGKEGLNVGRIEMERNWEVGEGVKMELNIIGEELSGMGVMCKGYVGGKLYDGNRVMRRKKV